MTDDELHDAKGHICALFELIKGLVALQTNENAKTAVQTIYASFEYVLSLQDKGKVGLLAALPKLMKTMHAMKQASQYIDEHQGIVVGYEKLKEAMQVVDQRLRGMGQP